MSLVGRRLSDSSWFESRAGGMLKPGDYGREYISKLRNGARSAEWDWFVCCPDGSTTVLWVNEDDRNGNRHGIVEHEDGTITVQGSILGERWHGWLTCGVWTPV